MRLRRRLLLSEIYLIPAPETRLRQLGPPPPKNPGLYRFTRDQRMQKRQSLVSRSTHVSKIRRSTCVLCLCLDSLSISPSPFPPVGTRQPTTHRESSPLSPSSHLTKKRVGGRHGPSKSNRRPRRTMGGTLLLDYTCRSRQTTDGPAATRAVNSKVAPLGVPAPPTGLTCCLPLSFGEGSSLLKKNLTWLHLTD